ncbi:MAG: hypothetical protein ACLFUZ_03845 [Candidatus Micrarchaeia archaeon]
MNRLVEDRIGAITGIVAYTTLIGILCIVRCGERKEETLQPVDQRTFQKTENAADAAVMSPSFKELETREYHTSLEYIADSIPDMVFTRGKMVRRLEKELPETRRELELLGKTIKELKKEGADRELVKRLEAVELRWKAHLSKCKNKGSWNRAPSGFRKRVPPKCQVPGRVPQKIARRTC